MKRNLSPALRKGLQAAPVVLGVALFAWLTFHGRQPLQKPGEEAARTLSVIEVRPIDVVPRVRGYGTARPARVWRAVAEVEGRVVDIHEELRAGAFLKAGEVALKIDPREYRLTVSRLEAEITEIEAKLDELATKELNDQASLEIEQSSLQLVEADLERVRQLAKGDAAPAVEVREQERQFLQQKQKVQALQNALRLADRQRSTLQASLAVANARLEQARLDLEKTTVRVPFDCRLGEVRIEKDQFIGAGESLFEADDMQTTEVDAQISMDRARNLLPTDAAEQGGIPDMDRLRELFDIEVTVRMTIGDFAAEWPARFVRLREQIDPVTRTLTFVVAVDRPYEQAIPGRRPPLVRGTFCEVELRGSPLPQRVVIPRAALHQDHVYIVDADNRLRRRPVTMLLAQEDILCMESGLSAGDRVIVADPAPAIEGMRVEPVEDESLLSLLRHQARTSTEAP